jgi:hypothetical protein
MADTSVSDRQRLLDLLSELFAVVRAGLRLYREGVDGAPAEIRDRLLEYGDESQRHFNLLEHAIRELGGDAAYESPQAKLVTGLNDFVMMESQDSERGLYFRLEGLLIYELRDAIIGEVLDRLADASDDSNARDVLRRIALTVRSGAAFGAHDVSRPSERIEWLKESMRKVGLDQFGLTPPSRQSRLLRGY